MVYDSLGASGRVGQFLQATVSASTSPRLFLLRRVTEGADDLRVRAHFDPQLPLDYGTGPDS
jgi:hypothetical protein